MVGPQDVGKPVRTPMKFFEFDIEYDTQEFKLIQEVFGLLTPLVERLIVSRLRLRTGATSRLVALPHAGNGRRNLRVRCRQLSEPFADCQELRDSRSRSLGLQSIPFSMIFGIQPTTERQGAFRHAAETLLRYKGVSYRGERLGSVPNPPIFAAVRERPHTPLHQPQQRPKTFGGLADGVHGLIILRRSQRLNGAVKQVQPGIMQRLYRHGVCHD